MILFQTHVSVPSHIIKEIGTLIKQQVIQKMMLDKKYYDAYGDDEIDEIDKLITECVDAFAESQIKSCDGWKLEKDQALEIANEMRQGRKIMAIKAFRTYTGAGLREAKILIDQFGTSETGAIEFMAAFI